MIYKRFTLIIFYPFCPVGIERGRRITESTVHFPINNHISAICILNPFPSSLSLFGSEIIDSFDQKERRNGFFSHIIITDDRCPKATIYFNSSLLGLPRWSRKIEINGKGEKIRCVDVFIILSLCLRSNPGGTVTNSFR